MQLPPKASRFHVNIAFLYVHALRTPLSSFKIDSVHPWCDRLCRSAAKTEDQTARLRA
jgi:hypothetical protein